MKLLLDTHTFLWLADGNAQLSSTAAQLLIDPSSGLFLSMASVWEIAIKAGLKKLVLSTDFEPCLNRAVLGYGIGILPITFDDCTAYSQLPFPNLKHRDPFDRMIVVHALSNALPLVGVDVLFDDYGITRYW